MFKILNGYYLLEIAQRIIVFWLRFRESGLINEDS